MEKLKVENIYPKEMEYQGCPKCKKSAKTGCDCGLPKQTMSFTTYSVLAGGRFYSLKGSKARFVQVGETIEGDIEEYKYNSKKTGKEETGYNFIFPKQTTPREEELQKIIDEKDKKIEELETLVAGLIEKGDVSDDIPLDQIPF